MKQLVETTDPVVLSYVEALLRGVGIAAVVLDRHMSLAEGSLGILPRRVMVADVDWRAAAEVLEGGGLGEWVSRDDA